MTSSGASRPARWRIPASSFCTSSRISAGALAKGSSNLEVARALIVSETTAKTHVRNVLAKLDLRDRAHAVVFAYESGLVRPGGP